MNPSTSVPPTIRFGVFELDRRAGEIRKQGMKIRLQGQPVDILVMLLERPGEAVTREELQKKLWAADTFVDFEQGLNNAMKRLRAALDDDAENPRFIETLPRRGYRFIGSVNGLERTSIPSKPVSKWGSVVQFARGSRLLMSLAGLAIALAFLVKFLPHPNPVHRGVEIVQVTAFPGMESSPKFSPDGSQIVFTSFPTNNFNVSDIYVKALGDERTLRLTEPPGNSSQPSWSPDGKTIAYQHRVETSPGTFDSAIFLMTPLGGAKHQIRQLSGMNTGATSWSPDAKLLAYDDEPPGENSGVFVMPPTGAPALRLTTAPDAMCDLFPAFSPDGKQIAFVRSSHSFGYGDLFLVSVPGREERRLASFKVGIGTPTWTADGKRIILTVDRGAPGGSALFSVTAAGGEPERLQFISSDAESPSISRQGDKLAFTTSFQHTNIWRVSLKDNTAPTKLLASTRMEMQPRFSPDGNRLAFVSNRDGLYAIWVSDADGKDPLRLVTVPEEGGTPAWSPSGKEIAFDSNERGLWNIAVISADGSNKVWLTDDSSFNYAPWWSADGKWIYFSSNRSGNWEIWKISLRSKETVQVTRQGGSYAQESPDGSFIYYQKPSTNNGLLPAVWRMPNAGGPEEMVVKMNELTQSGENSWYWQVNTQGIYFVDNSARPNAQLKLFNFATRTVHTVRNLDKRAWGGPGLAVSPDERSVLITQMDDRGSDIMMVENFH